jgi:feruloyl esterase
MMPATRLPALAAALAAWSLVLLAGPHAAERGGPSRSSSTPSDARDASAATAAATRAAGTVASPTQAATDAVARCSALARGDFATGDVPLQPVAARVVPAAGRVGAHCLLQGYVAPNTGIELRLPLVGWNGKFFHAGCTGSCGFDFDSAWGRECDYPLARGYACIISDLGHRGGTSDGLWAWRNLEARVDFGFRATHRATVAGKRLVQAFYGERPAKSYFMGCSTGGRQGLVAAQRFPADFDGIVAGAPVVSEGATSMNFLWNLAALADAERRPRLSEDDLQRIHRAVLAAHDRDDGRADGILDDPRRVRFDPAVLQCRDGLARDCLSATQVDAVRRVYRGPVDSRGRPTTRGGGPQPGSEPFWTIFLPGPEGRAPSEQSGVDTTRFIMSDWGAGWSYRDFDFDRDPARLAELEFLYAADHPDLRAFQAAGGRLIVYHGWSDPIVTPGGTVDWYEATQRTMGGDAATRDTARLFMVPGMKHCFGGPGAFAVDWIQHLEDWVERGQAPETARGAHLRGSHDGPSMIRMFPFPAHDEAYARDIPRYVPTVP